MGGTLGVDTGPEEGFAGVNIANAGDEGLVEESDLDGLPGGLEFVRKAFGGEVGAEGFGAESVKGGEVEGDASEVARILEDEVAMVEA